VERPAKMGTGHARSPGTTTSPAFGQGTYFFLVSNSSCAETLGSLSGASRHRCRRPIRRVPNQRAASPFHARATARSLHVKAMRGPPSAWRQSMHAGPY
jgi:hypothetical protein